MHPVYPAFFQFYIHWMGTKSYGQSLKSGFEVLKRIRSNWPKYKDDSPWAGQFLMERERGKWPICFLYSNKDTMMNAAYIERIAEELKTKNPERFILLHNFLNTPHVAHMQFKPDEYVTMLEKLLQNV